ncbi:MAG TPA: hypothetical protein VFV58_10030 [Blastocatellia bacterium]|jgi:hypothetical protein|nr:hypothetical protein [Blastocatellia bacterium]
MPETRKILIEGYAPEEILSLPDEQIEAFVFVGKPLIFKAGSAEILGEFRLREDRLAVELAQIEGGGEGVLQTLVALAERYAQRRGQDKIEWIVHAVDCAQPNPKLRRVLEKRGFVIENVPGFGEVFYKLHQIQQ